MMVKIFSGSFANNSRKTHLGAWVSTRRNGLDVACHVDEEPNKILSQQKYAWDPR